MNSQEGGGTERLRPPPPPPDPSPPRLVSTKLVSVDVICINIDSNKEMTSLDEKGTLSIESDQLGSRFRGNPGLRNLVSETVGDQWNAAYGGLSRTHLDTATCGTELQNSSVTRGGDGDRVRPPGGYHTAGIAPRGRFSSVRRSMHGRRMAASL